MKIVLDLVWEWHYTKLLDLAEALKLVGWHVDLVLTENQLPYMVVRKGDKK